MIILRWFGIATLLAVLISIGVEPHPSIAQSDDEQIAITGLDAPVLVAYNDAGVPHIYAETAHDLFMAQGYVEAADRFWQMEWWRHQSAGRLSEIVGESAFEQDKFYRVLNFEAMANAAIAQTSLQDLALLDAYVAGVNAYLADKLPEQVAIEYQLLAENGVALEIEAWSRQDTIRWMYVQALGFSENFQVEIARAALIRDLGPLGALIVPPYPYDLHPTITEPGAIDYRQPLTSQAILPLPFTSADPLLIRWVGNPVLPFGDGAGRGSNAWVISGQFTDTGLPYAANDPHITIMQPSVWYEVGLFCTTISATCPYQVSGFSQPGIPGVYLGNNSTIAWGLTNAGVDVQDLYILQLNPDNPLQYWFDDEWRNFEVRSEQFALSNSEPITHDVLDSVWGPVIAENYETEQQVLALRWAAYDSASPLAALFTLLKARNWDEFLESARLQQTPVMNFTYADVEGNIGYLMPGLVPIRAEGHDGRTPIDGSTSANTWQGFISFDELPRLFNPPAGYIVSANNSIVGPDYPYPLIDVYSYGYRARRIETIIQTHPTGVFTMDDMRRIQGDNYNQKIEFLLPALEAIAFTDPIAIEALEFLQTWDGYNDADSPQAALFAVFWYQLLQLGFVDDLGTVPAGGGDLEWYLISTIINTDAIPFWDNSNTPDVVESREDILTQALVAAWEQLTETLGDDPQAWMWGDLHTARFAGRPFGTGQIGELDARFVMEIGVGGGDSIVNANGWTANAPFDVTQIPSMRQIYSLADWDATLRINPPGQSGDPNSPNYQDQLEAWAVVDYRTAPFSKEAIAPTIVTRWQLIPTE